ncbi:hypothetical protein GN956_G22224 [Arapaima gigas]
MCALLLTAGGLALLLVPSASYREVSESYLCPRTGRVEPRYREQNISTCEQTWDLNNTRIAIYDMDKNHTCTPPCREVSSGTVVLDTCENVTLTFFCETSAGRVAETRVHFTGIDSRKEEVENHPGTTKGTEGPSGPPGSSGLGGAAVAVIVVVIVALIVLAIVILCYRRQRRSAQSVPQEDPPVDVPEP